MKILVDGMPREVPDEATVAEILALLNELATHILVEVNGSFVGEMEYDKKKLRPEDRLEVIYPAFGG